MVTLDQGVSENAKMPKRQEKDTKEFYHKKYKGACK